MLDVSEVPPRRKKKAVVSAKQTALGNVLSIDLGRKAGWALRVGGSIMFGSWTMSNKPRDPGLKFEEFEEALDAMWDRLNGDLDVVCYEDVCRHTGVKAAHAYGGYLAVLQMFCRRNRVSCKGVAVGTIKKYATNRGNAGKSAVAAAVLSWGYRVENDNEADAVAMLKAYLTGFA